MQLKVFCCGCFFDVMLKVKHCSSDLIRKAVDRDTVSCLSCVHFDLNVKMKWKDKFL